MTQYVHFAPRGPLAACGSSVSDVICYPTLYLVTCSICLRAVTSDLRRLSAVERSVRAACDHDVECEEEGEGDCCYRMWRIVALLVGSATNVTDEDRELFDAAIAGTAPLTA